MLVRGVGGEDAPDDRRALIERYGDHAFLPVLAVDAYRVGPVTLWNGARELLSTDIRPKLAHVRAPTLVIWGEHDTVVPPEIGRRLVPHLANAEMVIIPRAGHNPMCDRPEAFNRLIADFLDADRIGSPDGSPDMTRPDPPA